MPITAALPSKSPYNVTGKTGGIKNNGGTLFFGGTIANTNNSSMGITYLGYRSGISEAKPYISATPMNYGVVTGLASGSFATMTKGKYIMLTFTSLLAGTVNTLLNSPSAFGQRGGQNSWTGSFRTPQYIMSGGWDYTTGMPKSRPNMGTQIPASQDQSVYPSSLPEQFPGTRSIPGRVFYLSGSLTPVVTNYKAKTD